jgi:hypothetical protein
MSDKQDSTAKEHFNKLIRFRQAAYANLGTAKDALFELCDAVISTSSANSFAELSCSKQFRRRWPSAYEALQDGRPDRKSLMQLHERISSQETAFEKASEQLHCVQARLPVRAISLWDAEYGCAPFLLATANIPTDKVIRLRPNLNLAGPPGPYKGRGRHPLHGDKFKFKDPDTWRAPDSSLEMDDPDLGKIQVKIWKDLHFRKAAKCPLIVARLERLESKGTRRLPKVIWVAWIGEEPPEPLTWW